MQPKSYGGTTYENRWRTLDSMGRVAAQIAGVLAQKKAKKQESAQRQLQLAQEGVFDGTLDPSSARVQSALDAYAEYSPEEAKLWREQFDNLKKRRFDEGAADRSLATLAERMQQIQQANTLTGGASMPNPNLMGEAAAQLPPTDYMNVAPMLPKMGAEMPRQFGLDDVPTQLRPLMPQAQVPPEVAQGARVGAGLARSAGQEIAASAEDGRNARASESRKLEREKLTLQERKLRQQESKAKEAAEDPVKAREQAIFEDMDARYKMWKDSGSVGDRGQQPPAPQKLKAKKYAQREAGVVQKLEKIEDPALSQWLQQALEVLSAQAPGSKEYEDALSSLEVELRKRGF